MIQAQNKFLSSWIYLHQVSKKNQIIFGNYDKEKEILVVQMWEFNNNAL